MQDLTSKTFGRLTVLAFSHKNKKSLNYWRCKCSCGSEHVIREAHLKNGRSTSCGCARLETCVKHGHTKNILTNRESRTHISWRAMKSRCLNENSKDYERYGQRGISVCDEWKSSISGFNQFLKDMGERPLGCSLDRLDNNKGYSPSNCRWATAKEQAANRGS